MYRFLLKPRWIVFTVAVAVLMVVMVNLALWQLRRLDERRIFNTDVRSRQAAAIVDPAALPADVHQAEWRRVQMTGTWQAAGQILIRDRSLDGSPGLHVVTPLVTADHQGILVNRGFIALAAQDHPPAPDSGMVTVTATVRRTQRRGLFGPTDPAQGTLTVMNRVDVPRIQRQSSLTLAPYYVELVSQVPAPGADAPRPIPLPVLSEGPHLSYAVQWFIFTVCAAIGWFVVVRKSARRGGQWRARRARANRP